MPSDPGAASWMVPLADIATGTTRQGAGEQVTGHMGPLAEPVGWLRQAEGLTVLAGAGLVDGGGGYGDACGSWAVLPLGVRRLLGRQVVQDFSTGAEEPRVSANRRPLLVFSCAPHLYEGRRARISLVF